MCIFSDWIFFLIFPIYPSTCKFGCFDIEGYNSFISHLKKHMLSFVFLFILFYLVLHHCFTCGATRNKSHISGKIILLILTISHFVGLISRNDGLFESCFVVLNCFKYISFIQLLKPVAYF